MTDKLYNAPYEGQLILVENTDGNDTEHLAIILNPETRNAMTYCGEDITYYGHNGEPVTSRGEDTGWYVMREAADEARERVEDPSNKWTCPTCREVHKTKRGRLEHFMKMRFETENFE